MSAEQSAKITMDARSALSTELTCMEKMDTLEQFFDSLESGSSQLVISDEDEDQPAMEANPEDDVKENSSAARKGKKRSRSRTPARKGKGVAEVLTGVSLHDLFDLAVATVEPSAGKPVATPAEAPVATPAEAPASGLVEKPTFATPVAVPTRKHGNFLYKFKNAKRRRYADTMKNNALYLSQLGEIFVKGDFRGVQCDLIALSQIGATLTFDEKVVTNIERFQVTHGSTSRLLGAITNQHKNIVNNDIRIINFKNPNGVRDGELDNVNFIYFSTFDVIFGVLLYGVFDMYDMY